MAKLVNGIRSVMARQWVRPVASVGVFLVGVGVLGYVVAAWDDRGDLRELVGRTQYEDEAGNRFERELKLGEPTMVLSPARVSARPSEDVRAGVGEGEHRGS